MDRYRLALRPIARYGLGISCLLISLVCAAGAHATIPAPISMDMVLLRSDCVIFSTISAIHPVDDRDGFYDLVLTDSNVVAMRWSAAPKAFRVRGTRFTANGVDRVVDPRGSFSFAVGERHILLLRGGSWTTAPLTPAPYGHYRLTAEGHVRCDDRGLVYGVGPDGMVCSIAAHQAGAPLDEQSLTQRLRQSLQNARRRRSRVAAELDAAVQPLWLNPEGT